MVAEKVSRKKLLKEPDEFISTTGRVIQFLKSNRKRVFRYSLVVLGVIVLGVAGYFYLDWQKGKAEAAQSQGFQFLEEAQQKGANTEGAKEGYRKALEKYKEAFSLYHHRFPWGVVGEVSRVYIGVCHFRLEEYDQAIAAYSLCTEGPLRAVACNALGYCYEAKKDYAKAAENFLKNADEGDNPYQEEGLLGAARCEELLGQKPKALELYQKALARNPKSLRADFIQRKISELKG